MKDVSFFKTWLIFFIIATVGGAVIGLVVGLLAGVAMGIMGMGDPSQYPLAMQVIGWLVGLPVSFFAFKWAVNEYIVRELTEGYRRPETADTKEGE